jgi:DNA-binding LacI/PurR family transcriptional regulator
MSKIKDVAKLAGVSVATVSRVINGSDAVHDATRQKVMDAIKELGYRPNLLGRYLRRTETKMVLVLLPTISNPFYSKIVLGIEDVAQKNGYSIMLCNTNSDVEREKIYIGLLRNRLADGVIFMAPAIESDLLSDIARNFPTAQCCEYKEEAPAPHVSIDNYSAARKAVKHLLDLGHERIAMITSDNNFISTKERERAYRQVLEEYGIEFNPALIRHGDYGFRSGLRSMLQLLDQPQRPTAVFCISDMMAIGAIKAAFEKGLDVPGDLAVCGFDDIEFANMFEPPITTIAQPKYDLGCMAMRLMLKQIEEGILGEAEDVYLEHELIIRKSTIGLNNH